MSRLQIDNDAIRFRDGLCSEREIYDRLLDTTRKQQQVVVEGHSQELLDLAQMKERVLGEIEKLERELAPLKKKWAQLRERIGTELRSEVESELDRVARVLRALIELEEEGQRNVEHFREETRNSLRRVEGGRRIQQAYSPSNPAPRPRYLDRSE